MNYRSVSQLNADTRRLGQEPLEDVDLIVGIPRSGLLAANLLCLYHDRPMTDVAGLEEGRLLNSGHRYDGRVERFDDVDRALVIDDSVDTGRQMKETKRRIDGLDLPFDVEYAAVYVTTGGHRYVDHWGEVIKKPRVFEWNLMHHPMLNDFCVDIDGVLCPAPTRHENDDGENYREFLSTVDPLVVPSERIGWLVTCRLEKYREPTEAWLAEQGIEYDNLVMMDLPSKEARQRRDNHAEYKAEVYQETGADLFVESSARQAATICERTGKPVFSYRANEMLSPGTLSRTYDRGGEYLARFADDPVGFSLLAARYVLQESYYRASLATRRYRS